MSDDAPTPMQITADMRERKVRVSFPFEDLGVLGTLDFSSADEAAAFLVDIVAASNVVWPGAILRLCMGKLAARERTERARAMRDPWGARR